MVPTRKTFRIRALAIHDPHEPMGAKTHGKGGRAPPRPPTLDFGRDSKAVHDSLEACRRVSDMRIGSGRFRLAWLSAWRFDARAGVSGKEERPVRTSLLVCVLLAVGCKKEEPPPPPANTATTAPAISAAPAASAPAASASAAASAEAAGSPGNMAHCPTAVSGATVAIKDVDGGVEIVVSSKDDKTKKDVSTRTRALLDAAKAQDPTKQHTGSGGGRGVFGHCTIVVHNTKLEAVDVPDGTKITIKPNDPKELDWLRREVRERDADARSTAGQGMGRQRMQNCPSAVDGVATKVKDTKEGVIVTVTAKAPEAVKEVRDRSKRLVSASTATTDKPGHTGQGQGGGSVGRCPVVLEHATVAAKDVEGGSELTVKADKPEFVANLQKEAKERAAMFGDQHTGDTKNAKTPEAAPKK